MTLTTTSNPKSAIYTPFFKEVWDKKMEIEQAFRMEDAGGLNDSGEGTLERPMRRRTHPVPPPRHLLHGGGPPLYGRGSNEGSGSEIYERLPTDGSLGDEGEDAVSPTYPDDRRLTPSDDSDLYSTLDRPMQRGAGGGGTKENGGGEHLVKPSHLRSRQKIPHGTYSLLGLLIFSLLIVPLFSRPSAKQGMLRWKGEVGMKHNRAFSGRSDGRRCVSFMIPICNFICLPVGLLV